MSDPDGCERFLGDLPDLVASCTTAARLAEVTAVLPPGIRREVAWDGRWLTLHLDPAVDALALAGTWGIARPVATSGDVHQRRWQLDVGGEDTTTPLGPSLDARAPGWGPWRVRPILASRPDGPMPNRRVGAAPVYELRETGGAVVQLEFVAADESVGRILVGDDRAREAADEVGDQDQVSDHTTRVDGALGRLARLARLAGIARRSRRTRTPR